MKTFAFFAAAVALPAAPLFAQGADPANTDAPASDPTVIEDSFDDNRDYTYEDSFDDNSDTVSQGVGSGDNLLFNGAAVVAETALSNVITGVSVEFGDADDGSTISDRLTNNGNAFRNCAGNNALNQDTGVGASQNASVTIAVSGDGFGGK